MSELSVVVSLYRFTKPDGSTKDWAIRHDEAGVEIYFGKTGKRLQMRTVPMERCGNNSPALEVERRVNEQRRQGYEFVGSCILDRHIRRDLVPVTDNPPAEEPQNAWYWERVQRRAVPLLSSNELLEHAEEMLVVLQEYSMIKAWTTRWLGDAWTSPWLLQVEIDRHSKWAFGFVEVHRDSTTPIVGEPLLGADGCGRGIMDRNGDDPPPVAWLLFLLGLSRRDPDLIIADEAGQVINSVPDDIDVAVEMLEEMDLQPKSLAKLLGSAGSKPWFF
ncbi:MAG: hypothetical protein V2J55_04600 [Candidatus Competibacteraceae bacterium]|jgi:hypothetical protein|nr:hypothetical protein [Candidatus Competibacteraceae bacterium]